MIASYYRSAFKQQWVRLIIGYPLWTIGIVLMLTFFFGWHIPNLRFQSSMYDLAVEDLPETRRYETFKEIFGTEEAILVVVRTGGVLEPAAFDAVEKLADRLGEIDGVRRVISLPGIKRDVAVFGVQSLKEFEEVLQPVELIWKSLLSEDRKNTSIMLVLEDLEDRRAVVSAVDREITRTQAGIDLYQIGMPVVSEALSRFTERDFLRLPPMTFCVIALLLLLFFRNPRGMLIPLGVVSIVLIWVFGLMGIAGEPLNMLTMIVPVFLIAVGTAYCMYVWSMYLEALEEADSNRQAVIQSFSRSALPMVLVVGTTIIGVGSLFVNRIEGIRSFALFSCFGMVCLLVMMLIFLPALLTALPTPRSRFSAISRPHAGVARFLEAVVRIDIAHQKITLPLLAAMIILAFWGMTRIRVETNPVAYFKAQSEISRHFHEVYQDMSGSFPVNVVVEGEGEDYFEDPANLNRLQEIERYLQSLEGVDKALSFLDYLKLVRYALNRFDPSYYALPEESFEVRMLANSYQTVLGTDMLRSNMSEDFSKANILLLTRLSSSADFLRLKSRIETHCEAVFGGSPRVDVTGFGMVISASSELVTRGQMTSLWITLAAVLGLILVLFVSLKVGVVAILANFFPIIVNFGLMGWLGIKLSMVTSLIAGIAIGLAVDDTIHYLVGFSRELKKDLNKQRALTDTLLRVGRPMVYTTLTIGSGFAVLLFSHFEPTAVFGLMMAVTLLAALIGDLILLPSLMLHVDLVTVWDLLKLMRPLGGVASGLAHELNQPLNAIKMGSEYLKMALDRGAEIPREQLRLVVQEIDEQVDRASGTIKRLCRFDQKADVDWEEVDLNSAVQEVLAILGHQMGLENIRLELKFEPNLPPVLANANRIGQVVFNLLNNAREAVLSKRRAGGETPEEHIGVRTFRSGRRAVGLEVSDTGAGIPEESMGRVFEPFYTTKQGGEGLGLGLSIVYGIVKAYGGRIRIRSEEGRGSTFRVLFPLAGDERGQTDGP